VNAEASIPVFATGVKFRFDAVRDAWVLLAPERLFLPDEQAVEILKLVDGVRGLAAIVDELVARYEAPRELIAGDVETMLRDLGDKGVVRWGP
jgi:pyrroloquinoline quinone biosynthesis protein D